MAKQLKAEILIRATPEKVWNILTDFKNYPSWNPFIRSVTGQPEVGAGISVHIVPPGKKGMILKPTVLAFVRNREFRWKGKLLTGGLFDGEHAFELIDNHDGSTLFVHSERFSGILIPFFKQMIDVHTLNGFKLMNEKLKETAER
jgi:hypothetical protein